MLQSGKLLAEELKSRENTEHMGIKIGTVIKDLPNLEIQIDDTAIIVYKEQLVVSATGKEVIKPNPSALGTKVILIPTTDEQTYYLIDKRVDL